METIIIDTQSPEAKAFYEYSQSLSFVKAQKKKELSEKEVEEISLETGKEINRSMTNRFLMERLLNKYTKDNDSNNG